MDNYISRQTAQRLFSKALTYQERIGRYKWVTAEMKQWIADFVEDLPAADVQPVRHGHWINLDRNDSCYYACSICGRLVKRKEQFCPSCGTIIDEGEK